MSDSIIRSLALLIPVLRRLVDGRDALFRAVLVARAILAGKLEALAERQAAQAASVAGEAQERA